MMNLMIFIWYHKCYYFIYKFSQIWDTLTL